MTAANPPTSSSIPSGRVVGEFGDAMEWQTGLLKPLLAASEIGNLRDAGKGRKESNDEKMDDSPELLLAAGLLHGTGMQRT
ncbi:MAG: hypothetical protein D6795_21340, partial [Deltaproteobacteria bacterium]